MNRFEHIDSQATYELVLLYGEKVNALLNCYSLERIKTISFLGITSLLYQKEDTNRFSHSIAVSYIAIYLSRKLKLQQKDRDVLVLYYLFHDIGHLPNSHVTEPVLRLSKAKSKFHDSWGGQSLLSDKFIQDWIIKNIEEGQYVWENIKCIFTNQSLSKVNKSLIEIIKSPINPDTVEGIYRTAQILDISSYTLDDICSALYSGFYFKDEHQSCEITIPSNNLPEIYTFFDLQKKVYENYVFSIANQSAEAMWKKALLLSFSQKDIGNLFNLSEPEIILEIENNPIASELLNKIKEGKCLTPYWRNNHSNLMNNDLAQVSNNVYSEENIEILEEEIIKKVPQIEQSNFLALHFNRARVFDYDKQGVLFDISINELKKSIKIQKTQGVVPLSVFSYPFISVDMIESYDNSSSQKSIDGILLNNYEAIVITTPFSPNDTNLPAGPLVLKSYALENGINIKTVDLNIKYINHFKGKAENQISVGDHYKTTRIKAAESHFKDSIDYLNFDLGKEVDCMHCSKSIPFSFEELEKIIDNAIAQNSYWINFFEKNFFNVEKKSKIVGFSIMGTTQFILSALLSKLIKQKWNDTIIVAGGSHITLKRELINSNKKYSMFFDYFLPFHSEKTFFRYVKDMRKKSFLANEIDGVITAGMNHRNLVDSKSETVPLIITTKDISEYSNDSPVIPIQLTQGCSKGNCTMCTYNYIEEYNGDIDIINRLEILTKNLKFEKTVNISFKDSSLSKKQLLMVADFFKSKSVSWNASTRVDLSFTKSDFDILFKSGCTNLEIGIESIHTKNQIIIGKVYNLEQIENFISNSISAGIRIITNLIYGFPNETLDEAKQQLNWFKQLKDKFGNMIYSSNNMLEINQGSLMEKNSSEYGIIKNELQPWSFSYSWNAPNWRKTFLKLIDE